MKQVPLTKGKFALVDDEDYGLVMEKKWQCHDVKYTSYAQHSYRISPKKTNCLLMHRLILGLTDPKILIDHKDRNGLNNQKSNLRICNRNQNNSNKKSEAGSSSSFLGVHFEKSSQRWKAQISAYGKVTNLGRFKTQEEAARAYDEAAKKYHGEFASLNFKDE